MRRQLHTAAERLRTFRPEQHLRQCCERRLLLCAARLVHLLIPLFGRQHPALHKRPHDRSGLLVAQIGNPVVFSVDREGEIHRAVHTPARRLHARAALNRLRRIQLQIHIVAVPQRCKMVVDANNMKSGAVG